VNYFNRCLGQYGFLLTDQGVASLAKLISEALGNAEEHSGKKDWWVSAYLHQDEESSYGDFHITIFNLGPSIADTLRTLPEDSWIKPDLEEILTAQRVGKVGGGDDETVRTVLALQEHVSRLRGPLDRDRGQGTVDMIDFFYELGGLERGSGRPRMCILSGHIHILFDGTYRLEVTERGKRIAFNRDRDLRRPPDPKYVRRLPRRFPGTLISLRFYLDPRHLSQLTGEYPSYAED
jgi:hypothetical protein